MLVKISTNVSNKRKMIIVQTEKKYLILIHFNGRVKYVCKSMLNRYDYSKTAVIRMFHFYRNSSI